MTTLQGFVLLAVATEAIKLLAWAFQRQNKSCQLLTNFQALGCFVVMGACNLTMRPTLQNTTISARQEMARTAAVAALQAQSYLTDMADKKNTQLSLAKLFLNLRLLLEGKPFVARFDTHTQHPDVLLTPR